jgi:murein tripeptide amidase MpaA
MIIVIGIVLAFSAPALMQAMESKNRQNQEAARKIVKIYVNNRAELNQLANIVEPWEVHENYIIVDVTEKILQQIIDQGFSIEILYESAHNFMNAFDFALPHAGPEGLYHSYDEIKSELQQLQSLYPHIAKVYDIGDSWEKSQGIADRDIWAIKISDDVDLDENEPEILFIGCHHAREWISVEVPFYLAQYLVENYASDPVVRSYVDNGEIWIVPMLNPDGHQYTIDVDRWWRKNRRYNGGGSYGVDLNRNYGYMWGGPGSSGDRWSDIYRGPAPFSEPETQAIRSLALNHDFQAVMSYHSYGQLILHPWSYTSTPAPDKEHLSLLAEDMADSIYAVHGKAYTPQQGAELYLASGVTDDWFYGELDVFGFTIELRPKGYPYFILPESEIIPTWEENKPAAMYLIKWTQLPENPIPNITANGSQEAIKIPFGTNLNVAVDLNPGRTAGLKADWWMAGKAPSGWYWFTLDRGWIRSDKPVRAYGGELSLLSDYDVLNTSTLAVGEYDFHFGVDMMMNGSLDMDKLSSDVVRVTIE